MQHMVTVSVGEGSRPHPGGEWKPVGEFLYRHGELQDAGDLLPADVAGEISRAVRQKLLSDDGLFVGLVIRQGLTYRWEVE